MFKTFDEFLVSVAADGKNPCIPHQIGTDILMDWNWMVSVKKAREQNIESVVEFFDELDDDDEYKNGEKGDPLGEKGDDKRCWINYQDKDYLVILMHRMYNGFWPVVYKIGITGEDEEKVRNCIVTMKEYMIREIFRV